MGERIVLATRKGLIDVERSGEGWTVGPTAFLAEPVSAYCRDPRDGARYAALHLGHFGVKLKRSRDDGATWEELPTPAYPPAAEGEDKAKAPSLFMIWAIEPGGADQPGRLWAGTLPGGLFVSDDFGASWRLIESLWNVPERAQWFGGGYDHPGIHSILVDPRDSRSLTVGVSCGGVWKSADGGASWRLVGSGLRAEYMPPDNAGDLAIQDPHRLQACAAAPDTIWCQHHNGVFRSVDGGETFVELEPPVARFGFAVAGHPRDAETAFFVPGVKDECRVPADRRLVLTRTRDGGRSFEVLGKGLPELSYDLVYRHALAIDGSGERLAMGSTTGNLWVSESGGEEWSLVSAHLPPIYQVAIED